MRNASLALVTVEVEDIETLYGKFDIGLEGRPTPLWENRNLKRWRPPEMLQHAFFPDVYLARIAVNRRILGALGRVYQEIGTRWTPEARRAYGLNQYVKCYCFGDGDAPNLFWYGAAWELSSQVGGEILSEVVKIFTRNGFTHDKKRVRTFEFW